MKSSVIAFLVAAAITACAQTGVKSFEFGKMKLTAIEDASGQMPNSLFQGASEEEIAKLAPTGKSPSSVNCFLIQFDKQCILVDSGNGGRRGTMLDKLHEFGVQPEMVNTILLTHMHGDHIGGLVEGDKPVFEKATVYVSEPELAYWSKSKNALAHRVIKAYGDRLKTFKFDTEIIPGITARDAIGHTPGHTVYEAEKFIIIGDLLHAAALQFANPNLCPSYDMDMPQAVISRKVWYDKAAAGGKVVAGMHIPFTGLGKITKNKGGNYQFKPL